jgi:hypothetical protein
VTLWRRHPWLSLAFVLALGLTLAFATRFALQVVYWSNPAHQNQQVEGWMTVGYIGRSWGLPPRDIDAAAGLPPPLAGQPQTLDQIARTTGLPLAEVIARVEAALSEMTARQRGPGE